MEERPKIKEAIQAVFSREGFAIRRMLEYAAGKWSLRYPAASGQSGRIDVDINYMYRVPLWPLTTKDSRSLGSWRATDIPVVNIHELAAGKLSALLARRRARDMFDSRLLFSIDGLDLGMIGVNYICRCASIILAGWPPVEDVVELHRSDSWGRRTPG